MCLDIEVGITCHKQVVGLVVDMLVLDGSAPKAAILRLGNLLGICGDVVPLLLATDKCRWGVEVVCQHSVVSRCQHHITHHHVVAILVFVLLGEEALREDAAARLVVEQHTQHVGVELGHSNLVVVDARCYVRNIVVVDLDIQHGTVVGLNKSTTMTARDKHKGAEQHNYDSQSFHLLPPFLL